MKLSIIIPAYNEEKNVMQLYQKITEVMKSLKISYEIIFIDDGSLDNTFQELEKISRKDHAVKVIKFRKNFGQSAAWDAGFKNSHGELIITMDSDMQNDPSDIPKMIDKLKEGYDVVSGWRLYRKDSISKKIFSTISRNMRRIIIDDKIHDSGCSLKLYKKEAIKDLELYGEMHRYITELLILRGLKIGEIKVNHFPRKHGKTKYNIIRIPKGFLDLLVVAFWQKYSARPIHLFGGMGIIMSFFGIILGGYLAFMKLFYGVAISNRPLLLLSALLILLGIQFVIFGLIADILIKTYYSEGRRNYYIEKII